MIYDALVIGGGPAGATVAWLLARSGWSVVLLEKTVFPRRKVCGEFLSATSLPLLRMLGVEKMFLDMAGPPVQHVGLYAGARILSAPMPVATETGAWGRALGREHLDCMLLNGARQAGVEVMQPCVASKLAIDHGIQVCTVQQPGKDRGFEVQARVTVAAHGSWGKGRLPTHIPGRKPEPSDLLAFKGNFMRTALPASLMPLLAFPGGYGGMVHTDHGRVSLSCCIRRDVLQQCRRGPEPHRAAAKAVLAHIMAHCYGVQSALDGAHAEGAWLSAGPIQPGIRALHKDGIFAVGNTAGEAHPVVAEGISMAMQGAWLLADLLITGRNEIRRGNTRATGSAYARAWRRHFAPRLRSAALFAQLAMAPAATRILLPLFQYIPGLLAGCTRLSGKTTAVIPVSA
ncbi:MAG: NAD(P)/FAD-dependent oxidoreductase [Gammaproteobacteria bacterium]|nr:NAD(P)/FAD-dependent oxidoreductase [Gammaproteobacteria bacterium]